MNNSNIPKSVGVELTNGALIILQEGESYNLHIPFRDLPKLYTHCILERIVPKSHKLTPEEAVKYYGGDGIIEKGDLLACRDVDLYIFRRDGGQYITLPVSCNKKLNVDIIIERDI